MAKQQKPVDPSDPDRATQVIARRSRGWQGLLTALLQHNGQAAAQGSTERSIVLLTALREDLVLGGEDITAPTPSSGKPRPITDLERAKLMCEVVKTLAVLELDLGAFDLKTGVWLRKVTSALQNACKGLGYTSEEMAELMNALWREFRNVGLE